MCLAEYKNPIIRGYHPDPSICAVGEDFYLVNSTFEFFPGVPIYHSRNLINWEIINYCLTDEKQLPLEKAKCSGGIFAPTLRFHNGTFYMITTNVSSKGNFIVSTKDIRGKWSEPKWIAHEGIDPSLFFDDNGKVYYCGTGMDSNGKQCITAFEINPDSGEILSDKRAISYGAAGKFPEGPHIYKQNGMYYLMLAEGGTEYGHMETMQRSTSIWGPYEGCPHNPVLSNRDEMYTNIQCTGHADMAEDNNGNWWLVCLAIRRVQQNLLHNLGRETFLMPLKWGEDGWPYIGENGTVLPNVEAKLPGEAPSEVIFDFKDNFINDRFDLNWTFVRNPDLSRFQVGGGILKITGGAESLDDYRPAFVGIRQPEFNICTSVELSLDSCVCSGKAGISAYYSMENHYEIYLQKENGKMFAVLSRRIMDISNIEARLLIADKRNNVKLIIEADENEYRFSVKTAGERLCLGSGCVAGLCTEVTRTMTFTGVFIGLFAEDAEASFKNFSMSAE